MGPGEEEVVSVELDVGVVVGEVVLVELDVVVVVGEVVGMVEVEVVGAGAPDFGL